MTNREVRYKVQEGPLKSTRYTRYNRLFFETFSEKARDDTHLRPKVAFF